MTNEFHYRVIEVANMTSEELRAFGEIGLLPLLPLTKDGATREKVEEMFADLQVAGNLDLLQIGQLIASLAFGNTRPADQEWALRRYREMYDRLQETPVYKEMTRLATEKGRQEGLQEGLREGRQEGLQEGQLMALRGAVLSLVQKRFPKLSSSAKQLVSTVDRASVLENLIVEISTASTAKEARQYLRDSSKENTHD